VCNAEWILVARRAGYDAPAFGSRPIFRPRLGSSQPRLANIGCAVRTKSPGQKDTTGTWYGAAIMRIAHHALVLEDQPTGVLRAPEHRHDVPPMVLYTEAYAGSIREWTLLNILLRHLTCQKVHRNFFGEPFGGPGVLPDTVQPTPEDARPRGAARSARHPVTVEIVGSNPIGDARTVSESGSLRVGESCGRTD
jgi:hypothetical protein